MLSSRRISKCESKLTVAILAPFYEPMRKDMRYGGTERIVLSTVIGLAKRGHTVHLFATGDSKNTFADIPNVIFHSVFPVSLRHNDEFKDNAHQRAEMAMIGAQKAFKMLDELQRESGQIDVIHNHIGATALMFHKSNIPMVTTVHNNPEDPVERTLYSDPENFNVPLIGISDSHVSNIPRPFAHTVYNGIDVSSFEYSTTPGDYIFWMCRMDPCKGPELAIDTAVKAGIRLIMAGKLDTTEVEHFETEVKPRLEKYKDLVTFVGEIGHEEKNALMKDSLCLINPIQWEEPFGLVPAESMASGAPVVATLRGSMPELIVDGVTGFLIEDTPDKDLLTTKCAEAVLKCRELDRQACRNRAEAMFSVEEMVNGYIGVYTQVITKGQRSVQIIKDNNEQDLSIQIPLLEMSV